MCRFPVVSFQKQTSRKASYKERVVIFPIAPKNTNLAMLPQKKTQHGPLAPLDPTGFRIPTEGSTVAVTRRSLPFAFCSLKTASLWVFKGITGQRSSVFFPLGRIRMDHGRSRSSSLRSPARPSAGPNRSDPIRFFDPPQGGPSAPVNSRNQALGGMLMVLCCCIGLIKTNCLSKSATIGLFPFNLPW